MRDFISWKKNNSNKKSSVLLTPMVVCLGFFKLFSSLFSHSKGKKKSQLFSKSHCQKVIIVLFVSLL